MPRVVSCYFPLELYAPDDTGVIAKKHIRARIIA